MFEQSTGNSGKFWKGQTRYRREGHKILEPITPEQFAENMTSGEFLKPNYRPYPVLVYYSGVREKEALRVKPENFIQSETALYFEVGQRLKHGNKTPPLKLPLDKPFMNLLKEQIDVTIKETRVFPFCPKTAYNIMYRAGFHYPHLCRLSRITNLFEQGWTITQVKNWTGLSLAALNFYVGRVDTEHMGDKLT